MRFSACMAVVVLTLLLTAGTTTENTTMGGLQIDFLTTQPDLYYIKTEAPTHVIDVTWQGSEKRFPEEQPVLNSVAPPTVSSTVSRAPCWRLEYASSDQIDWASIKLGLALFYGVDIGQEHTCCVEGCQKPIECARVKVAFYPAYERDVYRVRDNCEVAVISVLRPVRGCVKVVRNIYPLSVDGCNGATLPNLQSGIGLCANMDVPPAIGCESAPGRKPGVLPHQEPTDPLAIETTWGKVKALYE